MPRLINPNLKHLTKTFQSGMRGAVLEGSSRCFHPDQKVITNQGEVSISTLTTDNFVQSFNHVTGSIEFKKVIAVHHNTKRKKGFKIKLKDGSVIICTKDHRFFYNGEYIEIKDILKQGEKNGMAKLTQKDVDYLRGH